MVAPNATYSRLDSMTRFAKIDAIAEITTLALGRVGLLVLTARHMGAAPGTD
jgi:hypothetical protein